MLLVTSLVAMGWAGLAPQQAFADPDDFLTLTLPTPVGTHDGRPIYDMSGGFPVTVGHGEMTPGSTSTVTLPDGFVWPDGDGPITVPPGNDTIAGIVVSGQVVTFTWADPWPAGIDQGDFTLDLEFSNDASSHELNNNWVLNGEDFGPGGTIVVRAPGDQFENV